MTHRLLLPCALLVAAFEATAVQSTHPDLAVVLGEVGWATIEHDAGEQAERIAGTPTEDEQVRFVHEPDAWIERDRVMTFFFEAFDENWKGGDHPDHVEKHWGLYRADRTPKPAMRAVAESRKDRP
ncbi:MAG TPA: glycosyl hydrolase family 17 protein [Candidatus Krumholzibacteria bacterium]|nr:glycosyl hydrolase family 17 protein [Candidatus Krumholzibacteria bacterium]